MMENSGFEKEKIKYEGEWIVSIGQSFIRNKTLTPQSKFLFILLKSYTNNKRKEAFPSIKTLRSLTGWSNDTLNKYLVELEENGFMVKTREKREGGRFSHNIYSLQSEIPLPVYRHDKVKTNNIQYIIFELFSSLIKTIENENALYSITRKFQNNLGDKYLIKILADCNYREMRFENENKLAAYLQSCTNPIGKIGHSFNPIEVNQ